MACDLASRGFAVNMFEMPQFQSGVRELFNTRTIEVSGVMQGRSELNKVTSERGSFRPTSPQHYGHRKLGEATLLASRMGTPGQELYVSLHGSISLTPVSGPHDITSWYLTEDVPYGLVPWSHIGKAVGVETPVIDSIVNIYNVVHERNWWEEGNAASTKRWSAPSGSRLAEECRYVSTDRLHPPWGNSRAASLLPNRTSAAADSASPGTPPGYQSGTRGA